jgi:hypothetical protein
MRFLRPVMLYRSDRIHNEDISEQLNTFSIIKKNKLPLELVGSCGRNGKTSISSLQRENEKDKDMKR